MPAPLLTFYGDDFTGSSAVMEVLSFAGIPTMLFLEVPDAEVLNRYPDLKAIGVAGVARAKDPDWMREHLPPVYEGLKRLGAPLTHYKVCSTFDSSPEIGSIGVAAELGAQVFNPRWIPLVVGAPAIGRFQVFGNLFAAAGDSVYRLDRHPVMSRHPTTPMDEADLCKHLSHQTDMAMDVINFLAMGAGQSDQALQALIAGGAQIIALDAMDEATLAEAGRLISMGGTPFAIGSQGVEYALVSHWRGSGQLARDYTPPRLSPVTQLFAVSGSCAPTTATQIDRAARHGFAILDFDATTSVEPSLLRAEAERLKEAALRLLSEGRDVLVTTARGPDDPAVARMTEAVPRAGISGAEANARLGMALGRMVADVRTETGLPRVAIGGGDTSGYALTALEAEALSAVAPLAPGAPLCRVHTQKAPQIDGLEVTLKGGQMGAPDFFIQTKTGDV